MGAIARLPLPLQVAFRRKMLAIFELQLLVVWAVVSVFRYHEPAKAWADGLFDPRVGRLAIAFSAAMALLVGLYVARNQFPANWLLLLLFTAAQSLCFVGLGVVLDTNIGVFNCAFTFLSVLVVLLLAGVRRRRRRRRTSNANTHADVEVEMGGATEYEDALLSTFAAGVIAYLTMVIVACGLFAHFKNEFVTTVGFAATLGFQCVLLLWFAYDALSMYYIMSPDDYMHGVIYFYTDLVLLAIATLAAIVTTLLCMALCWASDGAAGGSDCGGCGGFYVAPCCVEAFPSNDSTQNDTMDRV